MTAHKQRAWSKRVIGSTHDPLLFRWILLRTPWLCIYIHKLCRSDHDRALHDHPWSFVSVVLWGAYLEVTERCVIWREMFSVAYRPAAWRHRVVIEDRAKPAWTLVFVGPQTRNWGFWPEGRFCFWKKYDSENGICEE